MDIDCEHHRILLSIIQQIPDLNEDLQPFLQTVKHHANVHSEIFEVFLGEMVTR